MATPETWPVLLAVGIAGPLIGAMAGFAAARVNAKPAEEQALTERFKALVDRLETERGHMEAEIVKLDRVARDLEIMVIHLMAWGERAVEVASEEGVRLPPRPKFHEMREG